MITERIVLGMLSTNCYIVYDENTKEAAVIDPAARFSKIAEKLSELALKVKFIILTHAHSDHICALDELKAITGATVCIGDGDSSALNDPEISLCSYFRNNTPTTKPDIILKDGDTLSLGISQMKIITTPGHTNGSISIQYDDSVISGDTLFYESIGRTDFPTGDTKTLMDSIKNKLYSLPDETKVYPGHGEPTTIGHEKNYNLYVW